MIYIDLENNEVKVVIGETVARLTLSGLNEEEDRLEVLNGERIKINDLYSSNNISNPNKFRFVYLKDIPKPSFPEKVYFNSITVNHYDKPFMGFTGFKRGYKEYNISCQTWVIWGKIYFNLQLLNPFGIKVNTRKY